MRLAWHPVPSAASGRAGQAQGVAVATDGPAGDGATDMRQMERVRKATMTSQGCEAQNLPLEKKTADMTAIGLQRHV